MAACAFVRWLDSILTTLPALGTVTSKTAISCAVEILGCFVLTRPSEFSGMLETFRRSRVGRGANQLFEPEAPHGLVVSLPSGAGSMLRGIAKAAIVIVAAIAVDEYLYNGSTQMWSCRC
jgi:hypothetical protein